VAVAVPPNVVFVALPESVVVVVLCVVVVDVVVDEPELEPVPDVVVEEVPLTVFDGMVTVTPDAEQSFWAPCATSVFRKGGGFS